MPAEWFDPPGGAPDGWPWSVLWPMPDPVTAAERHVRWQARWWRARVRLRVSTQEFTGNLTDNPLKRDGA